LTIWGVQVVQDHNKVGIPCSSIYSSATQNVLMFFQWKLEDLLHFLGFEQFFISITWRVMELQRLA